MKLKILPLFCVVIARGLSRSNLVFTITGLLCGACPERSRRVRNHRIASLGFVFVLFLLTSCGGPLALNYSPKEEPAVRTSKDITVFVEPYKDARKAVSKRTAGAINSTVLDMTGSKITLDKDVSALVTSAFIEELKSSGFKSAETAEAAAYVLTGEIREFNLDIAERDKIKIEIQSVLKEKTTDKVVFSGKERVEDERFAGVSGNSRRTISDYMLKNLSSAARKTIKEAALAINAVEPFNGGASSGETKDGPQDKAVPSAKGRLFVVSVPERAKLYVGDIYYGLTPITAEFAPGVYDVRLKLDGYDDEKEKVSVREGSTTEMEVLFKKQGLSP